MENNLYLCSRNQTIDSNMNDIQKVTLLKEYIRTAKRNGLAKNHDEFCDFIGKGSRGSLNNVLNQGRGDIDSWLGAAKLALEKAGAIGPNERASKSRIDELETRIERIEETVNKILIRLDEGK